MRHAGLSFGALEIVSFLLGQFVAHALPALRARAHVPPGPQHDCTDDPMLQSDGDDVDENDNMDDDDDDDMKVEGDRESSLLQSDKAAVSALCLCGGCGGCGGCGC